MNQPREKRIRQFRLRQPLAELQRKRDKARRRGFWTAEDFDHAEVAAEMLCAKLHALPEVPQ